MSKNLSFDIRHVDNGGRRGGLILCVLDSGSGGPGSSPGQGTALCS